MNLGKQVRLQRIFNRETGRAIIVPMDHGVSVGPIEGIENIHKTVSDMADGERDLKQIAIKEVHEETGLTNLFINNKIVSLSVLTVEAHVKRGQFVPAHLHFDVTYLIETDEHETLVTAPEENSALRWVRNAEMIALSGEEKMFPAYRRIMAKIEKGEI